MKESLNAQVHLSDEDLLALRHLTNPLILDEPESAGESMASA